MTIDDARPESDHTKSAHTESAHTESAQTESAHTESARADWEKRIYRPSDTAAEITLPSLEAPRGLRAVEGRGQVTLSWHHVDDAIGYLVLRGESTDDPARDDPAPDDPAPDDPAHGGLTPVDTGGPDVIPVPRPPFTDTTGEPGVEYRYAVAPVASVDDRSQPACGPIVATARDVGGEVSIGVDVADRIGALARPWRRIIGSERLSQLREGAGPGDVSIGRDFSKALQVAHDELKVEAVRAHAILHDDVGVYREVDGEPWYDWSVVDEIYDEVTAIGLRPIVELSFMPRDLARDSGATVFAYDAIISPPKDWQAWYDLVRALVLHVVERYGLDEVRDHWAFEVWNEANLEVFWSGTQAEYLHLYEVSARAVKSVDPGLIVGGPATAASAWIEEFLAYCESNDVPLDFLSTHTYGNEPLDFRPVATRYGKPGIDVWWTEWGVHATHFSGMHDSVYAAAFVARGMKGAMHRLDSLAYWVVSDQFEELGRAPALFHGGFGLMSVGGLRKPRFWAMWMLEQLGDHQVACDVVGDGAVGMVDAIGAIDESGTVRVAMWNATIDHANSAGPATLHRSVTLGISGLAAHSYRLRHYRIDETHSNIVRAWNEMSDGRPWPIADEWALLRDADVLEMLVPPSTLQPTSGAIGQGFTLPMPSVSLIELTPV